jgi:hypothetical protein
MLPITHQRIGAAIFLLAPVLASCASANHGRRVSTVSPHQTVVRYGARFGSVEAALTCAAQAAGTAGFAVLPGDANTGELVARSERALSMEDPFEINPANPFSSNRHEITIVHVRTARAADGIGVIMSAAGQTYVLNGNTTVSHQALLGPASGAPSADQSRALGLLRERCGAAASN